MRRDHSKIPVVSEIEHDSKGKRKKAGSTVDLVVEGEGRRIRCQAASCVHAAPRKTQAAFKADDLRQTARISAAHGEWTGTLNKTTV